MPAFAPLVSRSAHTGDGPRHLRVCRCFLGRLRSRGGSIVGVASNRGNPSLLDAFEWPAEPTLEGLGEAIAAAQGLGIVLRPIPDELRHHEISGLTTVTGRTAHVFYDGDLSPLNREQTILHEYAHILHADVGVDTGRTHLRSMFEDPVEKRAETTGMRLLEELRRRQRALERQRASQVLEFLSGADESDAA